MSEMEKGLEEALRVVPAPEQLWTLVEEATRPPRRRRVAARWFALAAALAVLAAGGVVYLRAVEPEPLLGEFAASLHERQPIVPLASHLSVARFAGAPAAVFSFDVEGARATLVTVTQSGGGKDGAGKVVRESAPGPGLTAFEWSSGGQRFALVTAARTGRKSCRLCHSA